MLGEKDHGKSTLIGTLLIQTGSVSQSRIDEAKAISRKLGRKFEPGFLLDSFSEERKEGKTIDTTRAQVIYKDRAYELIDVPGHEELIKNMLSGASYGDVALLIISAKKGEGVSRQTKRHLLIANMLGIRNVVVAVNKMDLVGYKKEAFDSIRKELEGFIGSIDFANLSMVFVPISAYKAENVIRRSSVIDWYKGKPLIEELGRMHDTSSRAHAGKRLRVVVQGIMDDPKLIAGNVISGTIGIGEALVAEPEGTTFRAMKIIDRDKYVKKASAGDKIYIKSDKNIAGNLRGSVLCPKGDSPHVGSRISALLFATGSMGDVSGKLMLNFNGREIKCRKVDVTKRFDVQNGRVAVANSKNIKPLSFAYADVYLDRELAYEKYSDIKELGRFTLHSGGEFVGIGIIR